MQAHKPSTLKMLIAAILVLCLSYWGSQYLVQAFDEIVWRRI